MSAYSQTFDGRHGAHFAACFKHNIDGGLILPTSGGYQFPTTWLLCGTYMHVNGDRFHVIHDRHSVNPTGDICRLLIFIMSDGPEGRRTYRNLQEDDIPKVRRVLEM